MNDQGTGYEVRALDGSTVRLDMQRLWLRGELLPVGARLTVRHVFSVAGKKPVEAIYAFMLPRDAALRSFTVAGPGYQARSKLKERAAAEREYEKGMDDGRLAVLAQQFRDGAVNLCVGNLLPGQKTTVNLEILAGVEAHDYGFRFRFPFTLFPVYHPQALMTVQAEDTGGTDLPRELFGDVLLPLAHRDASNLHAVGFDLTVDGSGGRIKTLQSPSHPIGCAFSDDRARVTLGVDRDLPNRDLMLDVTYEESRPRLWAARGKAGPVQFAAIIPSKFFASEAPKALRVVFVVDRSGSMQGDCMRQARSAVEACLALLRNEDVFGVLAFDTEIETMIPAMAPGDRINREKAARFLKGIDARGGTELGPALQRAAALLGAEGGDLFLVTDGEVGGSEDIVRTAAERGIRTHILGIVSASQERFLAALAGQTGGISRCVSPRERVDPAILILAGRQPKG